MISITRLAGNECREDACQQELRSRLLFFVRHILYTVDLKKDVFFTNKKIYKRYIRYKNSILAIIYLNEQVLNKQVLKPD